MLPIRRLLLRDLLILMTALSALLLGLAWWSQQQALGRQAGARAWAALDRLEETLRIDLQASQALGEVVAAYWQEGVLDPGQAEPAARLLLPLLSTQRSITSLNLARADGRSILFLRLGNTWSFRELEITPEGTRIRWHRLDRGGRILSAEPWTFMDYDPRTRPWYRTAATANSPVWTEPYAFYTTRDPGITYTQPIRDAAGLRGVAALDFLLDDLTERVWSAQPTVNSRCLVVDPQGRALILPHDPAFDTQEARRQAFLKPLEAGALAPQAGLLAGVAEGAPVRVDLAGAPAIALLRPFEGLPGIRWRLLLTVPVEDLIGPNRFRVASLLGLALLGLALSAWRIRHIARRVAEPIAELSALAQTLGQNVQLTPLRSKIQEIQSLDAALRHAHASLVDQSRLQRQLEHSQRMETVGTLAGGIAHDVNNQLAAILGQLHLTRELLPEGHAVQNRILRAEEATRRCAQTTKALLSFSHASQPELKSVNLNKVVGETADILERLLGGRIRLNLSLQPNLPRLAGDAVQLEQVLMNLSVNARDAMPEGGILSIRTFRDIRGQVCLEVQDTGEGVPEEILPRIFEPFVTSKELGKGTGLGLAMVFGIVKAHQGQVQAGNLPEGGARFRLSFPPDNGEMSGPLPLHEAIGEVGARLAGVRILVVEDEPLLRDMLDDALTLARAQVTSTPDGAVAWRAWQAGTFDLVLSDYRMPDCTGLELLERIRTTGAATPFILISGQGLEGQEAALMRDPRVRLLPKPFELPRLVDLMVELLGTTRPVEFSAFPDPGRFLP